MAVAWPNAASELTAPASRKSDSAGLMDRYAATICGANGPKPPAIESSMNAPVASSGVVPPMA